MEKEFMQTIYKELKALPQPVQDDKRAVEMIRMLEEMLKKDSNGA